MRKRQRSCRVARLWPAEGIDMARPVVLLVDDDADTLDLLRTLVEDIVGVGTVAASDGRQAIQLFEQVSPALVILDIKMPQVGGIEVIRQLRSRQTASYVPIITLTAVTKSCQEALEAGCDDFIEKPFELDHLLDKIRGFLYRS